MEESKCLGLTRRQLGFWIIYAICIITGVILRIYQLDERPLHHDESIHATFGFQWLDNPENAYYKYDPTYHGPFLYTLILSMFSLFGVGVTQARMAVVVFGFAMMAAPWLFRRHLGTFGAAVASAVIAISPWMVFYSRFLVHDMPTLFFTTLFFVALISSQYSLQQLGGKKRALLLGFAAGGAFGILQSIKLISYIELFILVTFLGFVALIDLHNLKDGLRKWFAACWHVVLIGYLIFYSLFQTSFYTHGKGFLDGLYRSVLPYWWGQHSIERLRGPTYYHLTSLALHELPIFIATVILAASYLWRAKTGRWSLLILTIIFGATVPYNKQLSEFLSSSTIATLAHVKIKCTADIFVFAMCFVFGILGSWQMWKRGDKVLAFICYWSFASLAIFSFAGEKGPWLTGHVIYPMILFVCLGLKDKITQFLTIPVYNWRHKSICVLLIFCMFYQIRLSVVTSHVTDGMPNDFFSQVHNQRDVKVVKDWMLETAFKTGERPEGMPFALIGEPTWAFYFYIIQHGFKKFKLDANSLSGQERFIITDDRSLVAQDAKLIEQGYRKIQLLHNGWWVPSDNPMSWLDWLSYSWTRFNARTGTRPLIVYYKPL